MDVYGVGVRWVYHSNECMGSKRCFQVVLMKSSRMSPRKWSKQLLASQLRIRSKLRSTKWLPHHDAVPMSNCTSETIYYIIIIYPDFQMT